MNDNSKVKKNDLLHSRASKVFLELIGFVCVVMLILLYFTKFIKNNYFEDTDVERNVDYAETQHIKDCFNNEILRIASIHDINNRYLNIDRESSIMDYCDLSTLIDNTFIIQLDDGKEYIENFWETYDNIRTSFSINEFEAYCDSPVESFVYDISLNNYYNDLDGNAHALYNDKDYSFYEYMYNSSYVTLSANEYRRIALSIADTNMDSAYSILKDGKYSSYRQSIDSNDLVAFDDYEHYFVMTSDKIYNNCGYMDISNIYGDTILYIPVSYLNVYGSIEELERSILFAPVFENIVPAFISAMGEDFYTISSLIFYNYNDESSETTTALYSYSFSDETADSNVLYYKSDQSGVYIYDSSEDLKYIEETCDMVLIYGINGEGKEESYYLDSDGNRNSISYFDSTLVSDMDSWSDIKIIIGLSSGLISKLDVGRYEEKRRVLYNFCRILYEDYNLLFCTSIIVLVLVFAAMMLLNNPYYYQDGEKRIFLIDRGWLEVLVIIFAALFFSFSKIFKDFFEDIYQYDSWQRILTPIKVTMITIDSALIFVYLVEIILSIQRRLKRRVFIDELLLVKLVRWVSGMFEMASRQGRGGRVAFIRGSMVFVFNILAILAIQIWHFPVIALIFFDVIYALVNLLSISKTVKNEEGVDRVLNTAREIGGGNLEAQVDTEGIGGSSLTLAQTINGMNDALNAAVEKSVRDEKMKAELITNVSHDIKTPLTSIINYVSLIRREKVDNEKLLGYVDILDSKSQRLKQLIEDLIEASKASSGEIEMDIISLDFSEFMNQVIGESIDRFHDNDLEISTDISKETVMINADGRHLVRIAENLLNNAYKYSEKGSTIYLTLRKEENNAVMTVKNRSSQKLDLSADELLERFVRGDRSRSTEGSGLGLSIAKSLTELMNGKFEISIEDAFFIVNITFPLMKEEQ